MRRSDDVFFFTLIDFLVQVSFFGLLLYVLAQAAEKEDARNREAAQKTQAEQAAQIKKLLTATGVSNLTELTDELTKLAPIKELRGIADFISKAGGIEEIKKANQIVEQGGGADNVVARLDKLRRLEEGTGKPPCLFDMVGERKVAKPLATVVATDTTIAFQSTTPELEKALQLVGKSFEAVKELPFAQFQQTFSLLVQKRPDCRYTLRFLENTKLVYARDAARFTFYLNIGKVR